MNTKSRVRFATLPVLGFMLLAAAPLRAQGADDARLQAEAQHQLDKKDFSNVRVDVRNGVITLTGDVARVDQRDEVDHKMRKLHAAGVNDQIRVGAGFENVSDHALWEKLSKKLVYDRVGYGTTAFNDISLGVRNGVVTISGTVTEPMDKDSAISLIKHTDGVTAVVDQLKVAPLSPMDDRIRIAEARAIYGAPNLNKYAMDPAKPIRITVVNGHVTLSGVVDNEMDRNVANIKANSVPGVFSVTNNLQVQGQRAER